MTNDPKRTDRKSRRGVRAKGNLASDLRKIYLWQQASELACGIQAPEWFRAGQLSQVLHSVDA